MKQLWRFFSFIGVAVVLLNNTTAKPLKMKITTYYTPVIKWSKSKIKGFFPLRISKSTIYVSVNPSKIKIEGYCKLQDTNAFIGYNPDKGIFFWDEFARDCKGNPLKANVSISTRYFPYGKIVRFVGDDVLKKVCDVGSAFSVGEKHIDLYLGELTYEEFEKISFTTYKNII